jgi:Domain of unknown function (DUF4440)
VVHLTPHISGILLFSISAISNAMPSCIAPAEIRQIDRRYEESLVTGDVVFLRGLLADGFIWVHNHAHAIDSKESLLRGIQSLREAPASKSRISTDVEVRREENVAVLTGFTTVERTDDYVKRTGASRSSRYHFMRTYVLVGDKCVLLANQTMLVPHGE